jgi:hypothetical protein
MRPHETGDSGRAGRSGASVRSLACPGLDPAGGWMAHTTGRDARANTADDGHYETPPQGWGDDSPEDSANDTRCASALPGGSDGHSIAVTTTFTPSESERRHDNR